MAQYKQVKRNGRWVTINTETGKEVGVGEGSLGDIGKRIGNALSYAGKNLVYSDKTDSKGRPLTIAQAQANQTPKPKPKPRGMANIPPKEANAPVNVQARKPKPAPAASTTSKPKPKPAAPAAAKPKPKPQSKPMEKAYGESGKDLYQAAKKNNPLMQRTFGYQTGDAPDQKKKSADEKPASKRGGAANSDLKIDSSKAAPFKERGLFDKDKKKKKKPASGGSSYA